MVSRQSCIALQAGPQVLMHRRFMEEAYEELALRVLHKVGTLGDAERYVSSTVSI